MGKSISNRAIKGGRKLIEKSRVKQRRRKPKHNRRPESDWWTGLLLVGASSSGYFHSWCRYLKQFPCELKESSCQLVARNASNHCSGAQLGMLDLIN